jgi:methylated-DNA-[protein]-cysteine S-methyltransferase
MTHYDRVHSPLGELLLTSDGRHLTGLYFSDAGAGPRPQADWRLDPELPLLVEVRRQLAEYFAARRRAFDVPLAPAGTPFQQRVWTALLGIAYGATASYGEIARCIGAPGSARAVGAANRSNPIAVIVPCHRVVGADGSMTGYAGGVPRKLALLALERHPGADRSPAI